MFDVGPGNLIVGYIYAGLLCACGGGRDRPGMRGKRIARYVDAARNDRIVKCVSAWAGNKVGSLRMMRSAGFFSMSAHSRTKVHVSMNGEDWQPLPVLAEP
jgi:hypothetical protein